MKPFLIKLSDQQLLIIEQYGNDYEIGLRLLPAQKQVSETQVDLDALQPGGLLVSVRFEERGHFFDLRSYPVIEDPKVIKHSDIVDLKTKVLECAMTKHQDVDFSNLIHKLQFAGTYALCVRHANQALPFDKDQDMNVLADWSHALSKGLLNWCAAEEFKNPFRRFYL